MHAGSSFIMEVFMETDSQNAFLILNSLGQRSQFSDSFVDMYPFLVSVSMQRCFPSKAVGLFRCLSYLNSVLVDAADEKDRFMDAFLRCLQEGPLNSAHPLFFLSLERTAVRICENLRKFPSTIL